MSYFDTFELSKLKNLEFIARKAVEGFIIGLHKSPFHGFSVEFAEHKQYYPGDNLKNIDWKVFGRTDKLFCKKFEEETNLRATILIDVSSSMHFPDFSPKNQVNKLQWSCLAAASLIQLLKKQRDAFGLSIFHEEIIFHSQAKSSTTHQKLIYSELEKQISSYHFNKKTSTPSVIDQIADTIHKRSMVIIFSDVLDNPENLEPIFSALNHLKYNKHEVVLFHVLDPTFEIEFNFENRPYEFIDLETNEKIKFQSNDIKNEYVLKMKEFHKKLSLKSLQFKIDYVPVDIRQNFDLVLQSFLIKRSKMMV